MMIDGMLSNPFSAVTLPPQGDFTNHRDELFELSRQKYSRELETVENRIRKWTETNFKKGMKVIVKKRAHEVESNEIEGEDINENEIHQEEQRDININMTDHDNNAGPVE